MTDCIQVTTTTSKEEEARSLAKTLVEKRLAACAQVLGPITSVYWWQGKMEEAKEWLCIFKTRASLYEKLEEEIRRIHPYEVPEIVALPIADGSRDYLEWIRKEVLS
jgi:periplasmic divalent cation tolerance protein